MEKGARGLGFLRFLGCLGWFVAVSCGGGQKNLGVIEGPLNDPTNASLRRAMIVFGSKQFCREMLAHDVTLSDAGDGGPPGGHFAPASCAPHDAASGHVRVIFDGAGHTLTQAGTKEPFASHGTIEFDPEFVMRGSAMVGYFRTRNVSSSDGLGARLVREPLSSGFTVVREANGTAAFTAGIVP